MAIDAEAQPTPLATLNANVPVMTGQGRPSVELLRQQSQLVDYVQGMGRIIPCVATGTNVITLTPNDASPSLEGYIFGDVFAFWAAETSTGSVTMTVVPKTGTLSTLKAYITNGSAQAGSGNVVQNLFYLACYVPILDSSAGGFVLK